MEIDFNQVGQVIGRIRNMGTKSKPKIIAKMRAVTHFVYAESQKIVPMDSGRLAASGKESITTTGFTIIAEVRYGNADAYYAVWVHEDLTKRHGAAFNEYYAEEIAANRTHARRPEEQAKFLEDVVRKHYSTIQAMLVI